MKTRSAGVEEGNERKRLLFIALPGLVPAAELLHLPGKPAGGEEIKERK
jgi:hypothetical protein